MWSIVAAVAVGLAISGTVAYQALLRPPDSSLREFLDQNHRDPAAQVVVVAGDSLTHGTLSADFVAMLKNDLDSKGYEFVNAGANGNTVADLLGRLDDIVDAKPDQVVLLIGANDLRILDPDEKTPAVFRAGLDRVLGRLRAETKARLAVLSVPPLGEDSDSALNQAVVRHNKVLADIAKKHGAAYLPLNERLTEILRAERTQPGEPYQLRFSVLVGNAFRRYLLRQSWDEIAAQHSLLVLTDNIHLSDRGARVVGDLVTDWLLAKEE